jgi:A/G-specific adenine glycosylase
MAARDVGKLQTRVLSWFDEHGRAFPWRENRDAYATMVAEVMLQQTQTGRVGPSYEAFLQRFPTTRALAHAPAMDVISAWKGLGYNKRAVNLQRAAQIIESEFGGVVPDDPGVLRKLPGMGDYTANAIACTAYDAQVPVLDVNVTRVLSRLSYGSDPDGVDKRQLQTAAENLLPVGHAWRWNQALMDIGATLCRFDQPLCAQCPLKVSCAFRAAGKNKVPRAARVPKEPFEGSRRQKRGNIVDALRDAAAEGITLKALANAMHHERDDDLRWLVELLEGLASDGLVEMTPAARKGNARGKVRLPR